MYVEFVKGYFQLGIKISDIRTLLAVRHGINRSTRQILRVLHGHGLFRRKNPDSVLEAATFIDHQLTEAGQMHGYRMMHRKCLQSGLRVSRDVVYGIMKVLDPQGINCRLSRRLKRRRYFARGPNHIWHMDGYDKLKPYGICIHGCIDGFSRELIWLEAHNTNNDPKVIAGYFIEAVSVKEGCPLVVRSDLGTENGHVEMMQRFFRRDDHDEYAGERSFMYGRSTSNQRIEFWWGILRKQCAQFWMTFFKQLDEEGVFSGNFLDKGLIQFCFMKLIQVFHNYKVNTI